MWSSLGVSRSLLLFEAPLYQQTSYQLKVLFTTVWCAILLLGCGHIRLVWVKVEDEPRVVKHQATRNTMITLFCASFNMKDDIA